MTTSKLEEIIRFNRIPESLVIYETYQTFKQSIEEVNIEKIYTSLMTLSALLENYEPKIRLKKTELENLFKEYLLNKNEQMRMKIITKASNILAYIWKVLEQQGFLPLKKTTINLVPDYFKEVKQIYLEKYNKVLEEELKKRGENVDFSVEEDEFTDDLEDVELKDVEL